MPDKFFSESDKALLRFAAASKIEDGEEWIELPGPSWWWPDVTGRRRDRRNDAEANQWYTVHGFDIDGDDLWGYARARQVLMKEKPTKNWIKNMVHNDDELVWDQFRM